MTGGVLEQFWLELSLDQYRRITNSKTATFDLGRRTYEIPAEVRQNDKTPM